MADANQAAGQNVQQKAAQELMSGNCLDLVLAAVGIIPPAEGDAIVFEVHEPMVGDGNAIMQSESSSNGIARNLGLLSTKQWLPGTEYLEQRHYASTTINLRLEQFSFCWDTFPCDN